MLASRLVCRQPLTTDAASRGSSSRSLPLRTLFLTCGQRQVLQTQRRRRRGSRIAGCRTGYSRRTEWTSALNPDAPVFVPRMWLPPVAEDQTLSASELEHGPAGEDCDPLGHSVYPRPTRPNQRHRAAIARAGSCHVETCLKNFSITAGAVVEHEKASHHCEGEDTARKVILAAVPATGRPHPRVNQRARQRRLLRETGYT